MHTRGAVVFTSLDDMRKLSNVTKIVSGGFIAIFVILLLLLLFWNRNNSLSNEHLDFVIDENGEVRLLTETLQMVQTTRALVYRAVVTGEVSGDHDPATALKQLHEQFDVTSEAVKNGEFDETEKELWFKVHPLLHTFGESTDRVMDLVRQGQRQQASEEIANVIEPTQRELHAAIEALKQYQTRQINDELAEAKEKTTQNNLIFWVLLGSMCLVAGFMRVAIKRTTETERQIGRQSENIRALFEISASPGMSVDQQIDETLKLGARVFGLPVAKVSKINVEEDRNESVYLTAPEPARATMSAVRPLSETYCSIVYANE